MIGFRSYLFFILTILGIGIDFTHRDTQKCIKHKGLHIILFLLFHHFMSSFMLYGWLFPYKKIQFLFIIANLLMLIEWAIHGYCRFTRYANQQCDWKPNTPFRDVMWQLGLKNIKIGGYTIHVILACIFLLVGIYLYQSK